MSVKMTGVWTRKPEIEFVDKLSMNAAWSLISKHPYTIATIDDFSKEYAAIFGADELTILKSSLTGGKFDMIMSPNENWVKGEKVWVPPAPKEEPILKEGYEWVQTPFGKTQQPIHKEAGFNSQQKEEFGSIVYDHVLEALRIWSKS